MRLGGNQPSGFFRDANAGRQRRLLRNHQRSSVGRLGRDAYAVAVAKLRNQISNQPLTLIVHSVVKVRLLLPCEFGYLSPSPPKFGGFDLHFRRVRCNLLGISASFPAIIALGFSPSRGYPVKPSSSLYVAYAATFTGNEPHIFN